MRLSPELEAEAERVARAALVTIDAWEAREARPLVQGICIDSDHSFDRDDAIWFEELPDGRLQVDITIADVAAFISKDSPLDKHARTKVETEYGADHVIEPLYPFRLSQDDGVENNGILSLSDKSLRAGMTTRVIVNPKAQCLESVEVFPSLIHPQVMNYSQVADAMEQPDSPIAKWGEYTTQLRNIRRRGSEGFVPMNLEDKEKHTITHISEEGRIEELSAREVPASRMVEETALLANRANAQFMALANLPYIFRIHQTRLETTDGTSRAFYRLSEAEDARQALQTKSGGAQSIRLVLDRATYSPRRMPHSALGEYAYTHQTSPIRRYTDAPNQRMQHWLAATIAETSHQLQEVLPQLSLEQIHHYLGQLPARAEKDPAPTGAKLIGWVGRLHMGERETTRRFCREKIQKYLLRTMQDLSPGTPIAEAHRLANQVTQRLNAHINPPPYTAEEMEAIARDVNLVLSGQHLSEREKLAQRLLLTQIEQELEMAELQVLSALEINDHGERREAISKFSAEKRLPLTLHLSAQHHLIYRVPAAEILQRMQEGRLREPADLATILVQMKLPTLKDAENDIAFADEDSQQWLKQNIEDWAQLKETILSRFAANPSFTKGFIKHLEERYGWQIHSTHASLITDGAIAATMSLNPQPKLTAREAAQHSLFPPSFSIGHWGKTTRHHARLGLLRALAYDKMIPADKVKLPRALRLMTAAGFDDLLEKDAALIEQLQKKSAQARIDIISHWDEGSSAYTLSVSTQGESKEPIEFIGEAALEAEARALAWQALLRSKIMRPIHEDLYRKREQLKTIPIDADEAIIWLGEHNPHIRQALHLSSTNQYTQRREPIWQARLDLALGQGTSRQFIGESTQAEVATTFAHEAALRYLRERADYGEKSTQQALEKYERDVIRRYKQDNVQLSLEVPYAAKMHGREILPVDTPPEKTRARG